MKNENVSWAVFDAMPQFIAIVRKDGTLLTVNRSGLAFIGVAAQDVAGKLIWDTPWWAHSLALREKLRISIERAARGAFIRYKAIHPNATGKKMVVDFSIKRVVHAAGESATLIVEGRDVTERQHLEDALLAREAELRKQIAFHQALFDAMVESGVNLLLVENGRIVHANEATRRNLGYGMDELKALPGFAEVIHPDDRQRVSEGYRRRMAGEQVPSHYDVSLLHKDGSHREYAASIALIPDTSPTQALAILMDITDRKHMENRLRAAADYARSLLESSLDPMLVLDLQGRITDVNQATEKITGIPRDLLVGSDWVDCLPQPEEVQKLLLRVFDEGQVRDCPLFIRHESGKQTEVICNVALYRNVAGKVQGLLAVARDITNLREYEARLAFQATRDVLTGLPNRLLFRKHLERAVARAGRAEHIVAVLFLDLDNFKDINDTIGHATGDELLKATAKRLVAALRENDTVARMGGDEFAVLIEEAANAQDIEQWTNTLLRVVAAPHLVDGQEISVSCSIGVTLFPFDNRDVDALLRNADTAMYRAKEQGTNNFQYFTAEMNTAVRRRIEISSCLRRAIKAAEFTLHYQPRVELGEGRMAGVEALIRWNSGSIGAVSPAEFIPIAENNGMIVEIGEWVLHTACRQARQWQDMGTPVAVAVNLSARQFRDADIVGTVLRALGESGLPPCLLELELTESMLMHDARRVLRILEALKETGISLAIDDFGTGYSSLSYLKSFPLDYLKVDRSFVNDIPNDANDEAIVRAIIAMAHGLGIKVIAEGVETAEQLAFLQGQGCDQIQGYYFSKPLTADGMTALLRESRRLDVGSIRRRQYHAPIMAPASFPDSARQNS